MGEPIIRVEQLTKTFGDVDAVKGVSFDVTPGRDLRLPGPERRRQDHDHQDDDHAAPPTGGTHRASTASIPVHQPHEVRPRFGIVFQDPSLDGDLTAWENMELHGVLYHVPRKSGSSARSGCSSVRALGPPQGRW